MTEPTPTSPTPQPPTAQERPERVPARRQVSMYAQGSVANMLRSLLVIAAIMALVVLVFPRVQPAPPDVDVVETARQIQGSTGEAFSVPSALPEEWVPVRAQYLRSTDGLMTWLAAFETPAGDYVAIRETVGATDAWVAEQVNRSPRVGEVEIDGASWEQYDRDGRIQRSLVRRGAQAEPTTVVTGTASWSELETLVTSLEPVRATG